MSIKKRKKRKLIYDFQKTLFGIDIAPYNLIPKKLVKDFTKLVEEIHKQIVESTDEPRESRPGISLFIGSIRMLNVMLTFKDPFIQSAVIYHELAYRNYFVEGNKRTAHSMAKAHLITQGFHLKVRYKYAVKFIEEIADGKKSILDIANWIKDNAIKCHTKSIETYLNQVIKEISKHEKRGRPRRENG